MSTVQEIEEAIGKLPPEDLAAGRLDALAEEALLDSGDGRCTEL